MGVKKAKKAKSVKSGGVAKVAKSALGAISGIKGKASSGVRRKRRMTPESLSRQILILKLKKRLFRMKYGGR